MNVSEFLKEFKKVSKSSSSCINEVSNEGNDSKDIDSIYSDKTFKHEKDFIHDDSEESVGEDNDQDENNHQNFHFLGTKKRRYDSVWSHKEEASRPREGYKVVRMYETNRSVTGNSNLSFSARRRSVIPSLSFTSTRKLNASITDALREELLRKKQALSNSGNIKDFIESSPEDISCPNVEFKGLEDLMQSVDDLISVSENSTEQRPQVKMNDTLNLNIKQDLETGDAASKEKVKVLKDVEVDNNIKKKGKVSMFTRAKLLSSGSVSTKDMKNEFLETRKFSK